MCILGIHQGFIQDFELGGGGGGGGEQDGSRMIVACKSTLIYTCKCVCLLGGSGACSPRKILNLDPLRLLVTQSGTRLLCNTCDKTIITILNFMISGGGEFQGPPLLCMKPCT